jgi:(+)-trans-carveol dehydrogenase/(-)-trans-carveol dehydrogenase
MSDAVEVARQLGQLQRLRDKVAFVTGAARGQGRSHCIRMAGEGADIIAIDICEELPGTGYPPATVADLEETARQVEALDRRIVFAKADVRDDDALQKVLGDGVAELGRLDIVSAQAGLGGLPMLAHEIPRELWTVMVDITLTGSWNSVRFAVPHILAGGRGGAIVFTSSAASLKAFPNVAHYVASKHGILGLVRNMAIELGPHNIRVNNLAPTNVGTDMLLNQEAYNLFRPDKSPNATYEEFAEAAKTMHVLPIPHVEVIDISNALVFLASDEGRFITGISLPIDAGFTQH